MIMYYRPHIFCLISALCDHVNDWISTIAAEILGCLMFVPILKSAIIYTSLKKMSVANNHTLSTTVGQAMITF